jgi:drug/metabolite transporter superfamily protein YnfA
LFIRVNKLWDKQLVGHIVDRRLTVVFVLIVAFILPPQQAVIQVFEAYANLYFFTALSWAWVGYLSGSKTGS